MIGVAYVTVGMAAMARGENPMLGRDRRFLATLSVFVVLLGALGPPAAPAAATIAFVQSLGTATGSDINLA